MMKGEVTADNGSAVNRRKFLIGTAFITGSLLASSISALSGYAGEHLQSQQSPQPEEKEDEIRKAYPVVWNLEGKIMLAYASGKDVLNRIYFGDLVLREDWTVDCSGYKEIKLGNGYITNVLGIDEDEGRLYFSGNAILIGDEEAIRKRGIFSISMNEKSSGKGKLELIAEGAGKYFNSVSVHNGHVLYVKEEELQDGQIFPVLWFRDVNNSDYEPLELKDENGEKFRAIEPSWNTNGRNFVCLSPDSKDALVCSLADRENGIVNLDRKIRFDSGMKYPRITNDGRIIIAAGNSIIAELIRDEEIARLSSRGFDFYPCLLPGKGLQGKGFLYVSESYDYAAEVFNYKIRKGELKNE